MRSLLFSPRLAYRNKRGPMIYCCVPFCRSSKNKKQPGVIFHEFPSDPVTRQRWLKAVARENVCPKGASATSVVCCLHFTADDYADGPVVCHNLKPGAVPSVFPGRPPCEPAPAQRAASGRVRIKKTHGPDFLENLDSPTMDVTEFFEEDEPHCFVCYLSVPPTSNDYKSLLVCRDCNTKAHPSCLNYSPELAAAARLSTWQCVDCKTCSGCNTSADNEELIICDGCDRAYHMVCHRPKLTHRPQRKWLCKACCEGAKKPPGVKIKTEVDNSVGLPTPCDSPVPEEELRGFDIEQTDLSAYYIALDKYPDVIPDAKDWSVEEVEKFLVHIGFPEQAAAFRDQEIDGRSLLLLKRSDVLTGLSLKLGPALKIYNHIKRLQTGLPNGHLC
ncbi:uncharacterized protein LOC144163087 isoform X2 [Haemaphysalis longicornis]